jgi:hypothetical protein
MHNQIISLLNTSEHPLGVIVSLALADGNLETVNRAMALGDRLKTRFGPLQLIGPINTSI